MGFFDRFLLILAAFYGLAGVALAAYAAHVGGGASLASAANMMLVHAPAIGLCALCAALNATNRWLTRVAALALIAGLMLFAGAIAAPAVLGARLPLPNAAPIGGFALMAGWALFALAALLKWRR